MFSQNSNRNLWIAGLAASMMMIMSAPIAMAWNDDSRSNSRDNGGIVPPYMRDRDSNRYDRDTRRNDGIVPPYLRDKVDANRGKGW
jgi:hypothetical protein